MSYSNQYKESKDKCQELMDEFKSKSQVSPQVGKGNFSVRLEVHLVEALTNVHWIHGETLPFILVVLRKTWGYQGNKSWSFSYGDKANCRGIKSLLPPTVDERTIIRSVNEAIKRNIIIAVKEIGKTSTYGFNKHYDTWIYDKSMEGIYQYNPSQSSDTEVSGDTDDSGDTDGSGINKEMADILTN